MPAKIGRLVDLKELSLARNQLKTLPRSVAKLQKLERLDVSKNPLEEKGRGAPGVEELQGSFREGVVEL